MNFIIIADSWSNAYYNNKTFLSSRELSDYVSVYEKNCCYLKFYKFLLEALGHNVLDLSWPGRSNLENIEILQQHEHTDVDFIIWLHTHPTRDFIDYNSPGNIHQKKNLNVKKIKNLDLPQLIEWAEECSENTVMQLKHLADTKFTKTHILCLGGCGYLDKKHFKNPHPRVHHVMSAIMENVLDFDQDILLFASWDKIAEHFENHNLVDQLLEKSKLDQQKLSDLSVVVWPDASHPNANTIVSIVDKIFKYIEDNQLTPLGSE